MRNLSRFAALALSFLLLPACMKKKSDTNVKTLESNDWFREGKDRFYFAQLAPGANGSDTSGSGQTAASANAGGNASASPAGNGAGNTPVGLVDASDEGTQEGQEILVGIGCVKEKGDYWSDADPFRAGQPYYSRRYYSTVEGAASDFPMAKDPKNPGPGECVVLFGDHRIAVTHASLRKSNSTLGTLAGAVFAPFGVAISMATCGACVAAIGGAAATAGAGALAAGGACVGAGKVNALVSGGINGILFAIGAQKAHEAVANTAVSLIPCGDLAQTFWYHAQDKKRDDNRRVFFNTLGVAINKSIEQVLAEDPLMKDFLMGKAAGLSQKQQVVRLRKINNKLAPYFNGANGNRDTFAYMQQGWGTFNETSFFDMVREVNEDMKYALEQAAADAQTAAGNPAGNGARNAPR